MNTIVTLLAKRRGSEWRGAITIDNEFQDVIVGPHIDQLMVDSIDAYLDDQVWMEGDRIQITATIVRAK